MMGDCEEVGMIERPTNPHRAAAILVLALSSVLGIACSSAADAGRAPVSEGSGGNVQDASVSGSSGGPATPSPGSSSSAGQGVAAMGGSSGAGGSLGGALVDAGAIGPAGLGGSGPAQVDASGGGANQGDAGAAMPDGATGTSATQTFVCSQVMGLMLTSQWYTAGFEQAPGIDDARWQLKWLDHAYIDAWADQNNAVWAVAPTSPCAQDSSSPDRVLLVALSWTLVTLADWETNVQKDVDNIKATYPNVKQIVLMTIIRGPGNVSCGNTTVVAENTLIPSYVDQALADVAAANPDLVKVAPQFAASSCAEFMGTGPHLTAAGDTAIAQMIAAVYANQ
jgi:hypothetical protein